MNVVVSSAGEGSLYTPKDLDKDNTKDEMSVIDYKDSEFQEI